MEAIHLAAWDGDAAAIDRLVAEDGARGSTHRSLLMISAAWGAYHCVLLLLARFGDAVGEHLGMVDNDGALAVHKACASKHPPTLALLLDAGASMDARNNRGWTPLTVAAIEGATACVALLLARGDDTLEPDVGEQRGRTTLYFVARRGHLQIVSLLVNAGVDPTIRNNKNRTPLEMAQMRGRPDCAALLEAALVEPQRPRLLFKARALIDAQLHVDKARADARDKEGLPPAQQREAAVAAAPVYLKVRVQRDDPLPRVEIPRRRLKKSEQLVAVLGYVLGVGEYEGGGMVKEVFVELLEMIKPKWDPARKGVALGEGM